LGGFLAAHPDLAAVFAWPTGAPFRPRAGDRDLAIGEVAKAFRIGIGPAAGPGRLGDDDTPIMPSVALLELSDSGVASLAISATSSTRTTP
jgi:hypothetical protein